MAENALVISAGSLNHYHSCKDEDYNAEYLNGIGFPWDLALDIAAWAVFAPEGAFYEQDALPNIQIYII